MLNVLLFGKTHYATLIGNCLLRVDKSMMNDVPTDNSEACVTRTTALATQ